MTHLRSTALSQIAALVKVQQRCLRNTLRSGSRSLFLSIALTVLWYGLWIAAAIGCAIVPNMIGRHDVEAALPGILLFVMGYWQLAPLVTMSLGVSLEMRKVTIYPVSIPTLFVVECLLRLGTGAEMVLVLCGLFGGLAAAGSPHLTGIVWAFALFVAFNVFLSAGMRNLIERIFQKRRLREVLLVCLVSATVLPQVFVWSETARNIGRTLLAAGQGIPYWVLPSGISARFVTGQANVLDVCLMLSMLGAAGVFGFLQFRESCRIDSTPGMKLAGGRNPFAFGLTERLLRIPSALWGDPVGALVEKELKYLWRSPRFRLPFFMGFTFGVIAWVPLLSQWEDSAGPWIRQSAVTLISLYALLLLGPVLFLNRFGFDRGAFRSYFWLPLPFQRLLIAKNLATAAFAFLELSLVIAACWVVGLPVGLSQIAEGIGLTAVALLYLLSVGNHMSVRFPTASNPDKVSSAGPGHGLRAAVQFLLFPAALTPVVIVVLTRHSGASPLAISACLAIVAAAGWLLYRVTLNAAASQAFRGREALVSRLSLGPGPVASE